MVVLFVILMLAALITADVIARLITKRLHETKLKKERAEALDIGLRLDFSEEAKSLKRVTVEKPKACILAVDDEGVVLDSFRKILVLAGYSVDTVETGPEALGLLKKNNYDFVFTDLKMPDMDGLDVTKAVKHLRPDVDVIMITGYATIETAVDAMKYGAMDYVQKPFTEDELVEFVNKSLFRREARMELERKPKVHLVTPSSGKEASEHVFNVPAGLFVSPQHLWVGVELDGRVRLGMDDFSRKVLGHIDSIVPPKVGQKLQKGEAMCSLKQEGREITFPSPITGMVKEVNEDLLENPELINLKPYELGWLCSVEASDLRKELQALKIGSEAVDWYQHEIDKYWTIRKDVVTKTEPPPHGTNGHVEKMESAVSNEVWEAFSKSFQQS